MTAFEGKVLVWHSEGVEIEETLWGAVTTAAYLDLHTEETVHAIEDMKCSPHRVYAGAELYDMVRPVSRALAEREGKTVKEALTSEPWQLWIEAPWHKGRNVAGGGGGRPSQGWLAWSRHETEAEAREAGEKLGLHEERWEVRKIEGPDR